MRFAALVLVFVTYFTLCFYAMHSESYLGKAITEGIFKMQGNSTAFASSERSDSISSILVDDGTFSSLSGVEVERSDIVTLKVIPENELSPIRALSDSEMKPIWAALDKAYYEIPPKCEDAKFMLLNVLSKAKERNFVTKELALQWVRHVRLTYCFDMNLARAMFPEKQPKPE